MSAYSMDLRKRVWADYEPLPGNSESLCPPYSGGSSGRTNSGTAWIGKTGPLEHRLPSTAPVWIGRI